MLKIFLKAIKFYFLRVYMQISYCTFLAFFFHFHLFSQKLQKNLQGLKQKKTLVVLWGIEVFDGDSFVFLSVMKTCVIFFLFCTKFSKFFFVALFSLISANPHHPYICCNKFKKNVNEVTVGKRLCREW